MSQVSSNGLLTPGTSFKTGSGDSADSFAGGGVDMNLTATGDTSQHLEFPGSYRARAESFVSLAPSIFSTEHKHKVNNKDTMSPTTPGQHNR